jgi:hypothetical protein
VACGPLSAAGTATLFAAFADGDVAVYDRVAGELARSHIQSMLADIDSVAVATSDGVDYLQETSALGPLTVSNHVPLTFPGPARVRSNGEFVVALSPTGSDAQHSALTLLSGPDPSYPIGVFPIPSATAVTLADFGGVVALVQLSPPLIISYRFQPHF